MNPDDMATAGKLAGAIGLTGFSLAINWLLWGQLAASRSETRAERDKLDAFQDRRIAEQSALLKALTGKEHGP